MTHLPTDHPISVSHEEPTPGVVVLRVAGEIDMLTSPALKEGIATALQRVRRRLVIDLREVAFLGTSGLAALIHARTSSLRAGVELWLVCAQRTVLRPLRIAGLVELFRIAETPAAALAAPDGAA